MSNVRDHLPAILVLAAVVMLGIAVPRSVAAAQATMFSGPTIASFPALLSCQIVNVDVQPHEVTIEIVRSDNGAVVGGPFTTTLDAGKGSGTGFIPSPGLTASYYCKFILSSKADDYRANLGIQIDPTRNTDEVVNPAR